MKAPIVSILNDIVATDLHLSRFDYHNGFQFTVGGVDESQLIVMAPEMCLTPDDESSNRTYDGGSPEEETPEEQALRRLRLYAGALMRAADLFEARIKSPGHNDPLPAIAAHLAQMESCQ